MGTISFEKVKEWVSKNHSHPVKLCVYRGKDTVDISEDSKQSDGWNKRLITPSTPLSAVLMLQDDMYNAIPSTARYSQLREETTQLQEKATLHLKGRSWPVRRTAEGLAGVGLEEEKHSLWTALGWRALCYLRECQIIVFNESLKSIDFYPEDIRIWSKERPVYIMDATAHTVLISPENYNILTWICNQEKDGYTVMWPHMDGTLEEIKTAAVSVGESSVKITKDKLGAKVGRAQAVKVLKSWY
jgi:hypothetical protein